MYFKQLIKSISVSLPVNIADFQVRGITADSRKVTEGFIFVAVPGQDFDGHSFVPEALARGAKVVIGGLDFDFAEGTPYIGVSDTRCVLAKLLAQFYNQPSKKMKVVGITGTNGKTTVAYLIEAILKAAQHCPGVIGTINYRFKDKLLKANNTTPGPEEIQILLDEMHTQGVDYVVAEVSSHALDQERVAGIEFCSGVFTNLSSDHLDYHHDLETYFKAKSKLFYSLSEHASAVINIDDAKAEELIKITKAGVLTYGLNSQADVRAENINSSLQGSQLCLRFSSCLSKKVGIDQLNLRTSLIGEYNIYNVMAAAAFSLTQNIEPQVIAQAIRTFTGTPGRLQQIQTQDYAAIFVDYAHTEDALKNTISALSPLCKGKLYVVFGCGGDRDKSKRPKMGRVVSELADFAVITTDNPRSEDPEAIINDITAGISKKNFKIALDRRQAIKEALSLAQKDDIILVAGKGHENYQVLKHQTVHFDDREVIREFLST